MALTGQWSHSTLKFSLTALGEGEEVFVSCIDFVPHHFHQAWYNLHVVLVHTERWCDVQGARLIKRFINDAGRFTEKLLAVI